MVGVLNIHRGDVVSKENDLIRVEFFPVFPCEGFFSDEAALDHPDYKCPRSREWIDDVHVLIREGAVEFFPQDVGDALVDEVDDFYRRVDDTELVDGLREGFLEEFVIELDDDLLLRRGVVDTFAALTDGVIEALHGRLVFFVGSLVHEV